MDVLVEPVTGARRGPGGLLLRLIGLQDVRSRPGAAAPILGDAASRLPPGRGRPPEYSPHREQGTALPGTVKTAVRTWRRAAAGLALAVAALFVAPAGAQTVSITSTNPPTLTEANLHGATLDIRLEGATFPSINFENPDDVMNVFGLGTNIPELNISEDVPPNVSADNRRATLTLDFTGDITPGDMEWYLEVEVSYSGGLTPLLTNRVHVTPSSAAIASTTPLKLTEADLHGAELTVELTGTTFESGVTRERFELDSKIPGLTISDVSDVASGDTTATLTLDFTGGITTDATVAVKVLESAHAGREPLTTGTVTVAPGPEPGPEESPPGPTDTPGSPAAAITSPNPPLLSEADLNNGAALTVELTDTTFENGVTRDSFELVPDIQGLSISDVSDIASGDTSATLTLAFDGDVTADATVAVKVLAAAHGGDGDLTTGTVAVAPSDAAAISSTDPAALTEGNLDGATLAVALTDTTFASGVAASHFALVTEVPGVSVARVSGAAEGGRAATLTLAFTGDISTDETLAVTVAAAAHAGSEDLTTDNSVTVAVVPDAPPRARLKAVNESVLPELSRAMWGSVLDAVTGRLESPGGAAPATAAGGLAAAARVLRANGRALEDGSASWKTAVGGESFAFGLGAGGDGASGGAGAVVWGAGDWRRLGREERALDWSGDLFAAHLGVDAGPARDLRGGLAASWFSSEIDYTDRSGTAAVEGAHESRMAMLTPWLGWDAGDGTRGWTAAGYGWGEIEIVDADLPAGAGRQSADSRFLGVAAGGARRLWSSGALTLGVKGSAEATHHEVEDNGDEIAGLSVATRRLRLGVEGARVYALAGGASLTPTAEAGMRYDGGDGATGGGWEVGGGLSWTDPSRGLTVEARSRALAAHRRKLDDWGVSGALRLDPGADGRGPSFRLRSSWGGAAGSGAAGRWEEAAVFPARTDEGRRPAAQRVETELGYGLPVFAGAGAATPYTGLAFARDGEREARIGARLGLRAGLALDLRATRGRARSGALDHAIALRAAARW